MPHAMPPSRHLLPARSRACGRQVKQETSRGICGGAACCRCCRRLQAGGRCRWRRPHLRNGSSAQLLITCLHRLLWDIKSLFLGADAGRRSCMWLRRAPAACTRVETRRRRGGAGLPTVRCNCCGSLGRAAGLHLWGMTGRGECRRASRARDGRSLSIERYAR
jgi:hypothetical protein